MRKRANILGVPIDIITLEGAFQRFKELIQRDLCSMIVTPNTEIVMTASEDEYLKELINASDLCIPDGIGLIYASKIHHLGLTERVTGVDLMKKILKYCHEHKKSIYILGGKPQVAQMACENIYKVFPDIEVKGFHDGYFDEGKEMGIIDHINKMRPDVLFVALGAPRQERWIYQNKNKLNVRVAMGVGGSIDIWAGTVKRAPEIFQRLGLEWFYRLLKEPWRYKRMMALPRFMIRILLEKA